MEEKTLFTPFQYYRRAFWVALTLTVLLGVTLSSHLFHVKSTQAYNEIAHHFKRLDTQLDNTLTAVQSVLSGAFTSLEQPVHYQYELPKQVLSSQLGRYFYHQLSDDAGELVGLGGLSNSEFSNPYWQKIIALGGVFNTALALLEPLEAIAYVDEQGMVFIKRRNKGNSELLSKVVAGRFSPDFELRAYGSSSRIELSGKMYFALGKKRISTSKEHILLIFDSEKFAAQFTNTLNDHIQLSIVDKYHNNLIANAPLGLPKTEHNSLLSPWQGGIAFYENKLSRPVDLVLSQSEKAFIYYVLSQVGPVFFFILLFILATFFPLSWLCKRVFVKPIQKLMKYIQSPEAFSDTYIVPPIWQAEFAKAKQLVGQREQAIERLSQAQTSLEQQLTEQKQALARSVAIKERHAALLNTVLDSVPDAIYFKNLDGSFISCNRAFECLLGLSRQKLAGHTLDEVSDGLHMLLELEEKAQQQHKPISDTIELFNKVYMFTAAPFYNEQQGVMGEVGVLRDITAQQTMLKDLKSSEENFKSAIENAPNGVALVTIDGKIITLNHSAQKYFGSEKPMQDEHISQLVGAENYYALAQVFQELLGCQNCVKQMNIVQQGEFTFLQLRVALIRNEDNSANYFVLHIQDNTQITQAKLEAERATLAKSRFIANLSHEIRTPLNVILGLVDIIKKQNADKDQLHQLEMVQHAAEQLLTMLNNILDFAKVESHQAHVKKGSFTLSNWCDDIYQLIEPLALKKGLALAFEVDINIYPQLWGDDQKLKHILINLLANAIKYTPSGGVSLCLEMLHATDKAQTIRFLVKDTGVGIKDADKAKLFDAFTQLDESLTREHEGIGLGLAIVKHEVELLGGHISVLSEYGKGSTFYFDLELPVGKLEWNDNCEPILWLGRSQLGAEYLYAGPINCIESSTKLNPVDALGLKTLVIEPGYPLAECEALIARLPLKNDEITILLNDQISLKNQTNLNANIKLVELPRYAFSQSVAYRLAQQTELAEQDTAQALNVPVGALCLVFDDNEMNLAITRNLLEELKANVVTLDSAKNCVEVVKELKPDIIFMDIHMPEIDGFQASESINTALPELDVPIVALTANEQVTNEPAFIRAKMKTAVNKPVSLNTLSLILVELVDNDLKFFDHTFALQQVMEKEDFLATMLEKFAKLCSKYIKQLNEKQPHDTLILISHSVKGAAAGLGFERLADCAKQLEMHLKSTSELTKPDLLSALYLQLLQVEYYLKVRTQGC